MERRLTAAQFRKRIVKRRRRAGEDMERELGRIPVAVGYHEWRFTRDIKWWEPLAAWWRRVFGG